MFALIVGLLIVVAPERDFLFCAKKSHKAWKIHTNHRKNSSKMRLYSHLP